MSALQEGGPNPHFEGLHHGETDELRALRLKQAARIAELEAALKVAGEALQLAIRQNEHDMLMTGTELRQCDAALQQIKEAQREG